MKDHTEQVLCTIKGKSYEPFNQYPNGKLTRYWCFDEDELEHLVSLVAKDCVHIIQRQIMRNGNTPENLRSYGHIESIASKYDIELP
jgi:hypothetical protein